MAYKRYAIYFTPTGDLATFTAAWLGWDMALGETVEAPDIAGLPAAWDNITSTPRKYGAHATIKPPFRLAENTTEGALTAALKTHCATQPAVHLDGLELAQLGRFLALVPQGDTTALAALAANTVKAFEPFRAPLTEAELAKRRASTLTPKQDMLLVKWGYPYVMDQFRWHITLSGKLHKAQTTDLRAALHPHIMPLLPKPFPIDALSLCGEDEKGRFHLIHRVALSG